MKTQDWNPTAAQQPGQSSQQPLAQHESCSKPHPTEHLNISCPMTQCLATCAPGIILLLLSPRSHRKTSVLQDPRARFRLVLLLSTQHGSAPVTSSSPQAQFCSTWSCSGRGLASSSANLSSCCRGVSASYKRTGQNAFWTPFRTPWSESIGNT